MEPIHQAAYGDDVAAIERLVAADPSCIDEMGPSGFTPLMYAAVLSRCEATIKRLIELGADLYTVGGTVMTATHMACYHGRHSALGALLDAGSPRIYGVLPGRRC